MKSTIARYWNKSIETFAVRLMPRKQANLMQCGKDELWNPYFEDAEPKIDDEWERFIWPTIKDFNFETVLELAPGGGRNTEKLTAVSNKIIAVDFNAYAIEQTRERLGSSHGGCQIEYHVNNGTDLQMIKDNSVSAIYSWDAAVHFDASILECYVPEFARVLKPGGFGFVHHSDLGEKRTRTSRRTRAGEAT